MLLVSAPTLARSSLHQESAATVQKISPPPSEVAVPTFSELRHHILNAISGAKERVWVVTDYLTDGEIVSALYIAQYRRIDVQVLLGREKSRSYMSRLDYLKAQNIAVYLKPPEFPLNIPTALLVDHDLFYIDTDLDFMASDRRYQIRPTTSTTRHEFVSAFHAATNQKIPAIPRPIPRVGRPRAISSSGGAAKNLPHDQSGAYNYDRASRQRMAPPGLPTKLPRETIYQRRQKLELEKSGN